MYTVKEPRGPLEQKYWSTGEIISLLNAFRLKKNLHEVHFQKFEMENLSQKKCF